MSWLNFSYYIFFLSVFSAQLDVQTIGQKSGSEHNAGECERGDHWRMVRRHLHASQPATHAQHDLFRRVPHWHPTARLANAQHQNTYREATRARSALWFRISRSIDTEFFFSFSFVVIIIIVIVVLFFFISTRNHIFTCKFFFSSNKFRDIFIHNSKNKQG